MSSYLNIYLLPREKEVQNPKPLFLMQWSRSSGVYQAIKESINPSFIGSGETTNYSDLTKEGLDTAISSVEEDIKDWKKRIQSRVDALNKLDKVPQETIDQYIQDTMDDNEYILELQDTLSELYALRNIVVDIEYSDFEKVLCNID